MPDREFQVYSKPVVTSVYCLVQVNERFDDNDDNTIDEDDAADGEDGEVASVGAMKCSVYRLTIVSFAMAAMAVTVLSLAVATDSWLLMREKMVFEGLALNDSWTRVWAGMWRLCMEMEYGQWLLWCPTCTEVNALMMSIMT